jgi:hypothetical protein
MTVLPVGRDLTTITAAGPAETCVFDEALVGTGLAESDPICAAGARSIVVANGAVWAFDRDRVLQIDEATGDVVQQIWAPGFEAVANVGDYNGGATVFGDRIVLQGDQFRWFDTRTKDFGAYDNLRLQSLSETDFRTSIAYDNQLILIEGTRWRAVNWSTGEVSDTWTTNEGVSSVSPVRPVGDGGGIYYLDGQQLMRRIHAGIEQLATLNVDLPDQQIGALVLGDRYVYAIAFLPSGTTIISVPR